MKKILTFEEIQKYLVRDRHVRSQVSRKYGSNAPKILEILAKGDDPDIADADVSTFLIDLLHNDAHLYSRFTARGSYGNYHIDIKGLGGVYFYWAPEFGSTGYFLSIDEASDAIVSNWSDSLTSSSGRVYRKPFLDESLGPDSSSGNASQAISSRSRQKSDPAKRVFGFYLDDTTGHIYWHSKFGPDNRTDISSLVSEAFKRSEVEVRSALSKAQEINWAEAGRALKAAYEAKKQIADLEREISTLRGQRLLEIEVDDWLRNHGISDPTADDFKMMANALKPFFRYREEATSWSAKMPDKYLEAYRRLNGVRAKIHAKQTRPDEE